MASDARPQDIPSTSASGCAPENRRFALIAAILASSMGFIDGSVVALAMPAIRTDLGASLIDAQWISNSYMLLLSSLVLMGGAAGDVFGVRSIFAAGIAMFMAASLACALAGDAATLIAMRALQGAGAALMVPGSLTLIAKTYPADTRGWAIGRWAAFSSLTTALGPFLGGMVLSFGSSGMWRLIFAINVPIGLLALALLFAKVPQDRPAAGRRLDLPGALLATAALGDLAWGCTAFGLDRAELRVSPWVWLVLGMALSLIFVWWERRTAAPMVKLGLFASKAFSGANLYTLILWFGFIGSSFFLPMTLVSAWGTPAWQASLMFLPLSVLIALLSSRMGRLADRIGPRLPLTLGAILSAVAFLGLAATTPLMMLWSVTFPLLMLNGLGMAILVSPLSAAVMMAAPDEDAGLASGVNNAVARAAGLVAVAALGAVAATVYAQAVGEGLAGIQFGAEVALPLAPDAEMLRVSASNAAYQAVTGISGVMAAIAAAIAWFTQPAWRRERT